jgi:hypothetical protein
VKGQFTFHNAVSVIQLAESSEYRKLSDLINSFAEIRRPARLSALAELPAIQIAPESRNLPCQHHPEVAQ